MRSFALAIVLVIACGGEEKGSKKEPGVFDRSKIRLAKLQVDTYAMSSYPKWALSFVDKTCPADLKELLVWEGRPLKDLEDRWGRPYTMVCGKDAPDEVRGIGVVSSGPDEQAGTEDDIKSWAKPKE